MQGAKYEALGRHLGTLAFNEWRASFREIEGILGFDLPPSARKHRAWWANDVRQSQPLAWLDAGWKTDQVDFGTERVVFRRDAGSHRMHTRKTTAVLRASGAAVSPGEQQPGVARHERPVALEAIAEQADHSVRDLPLQSSPIERPQGIQAHGPVSRYAFGYEWRSVGSVVLDGEGRLGFPKQLPVPAVYRFQFTSGHREKWYIGETDNLTRRFAHYRNPGPTQETNIRINALLVESLRTGSDIAVSVITAAWLNPGKGREVADLASKVVRRAIENIALIDCAKADVESLNRDVGSIPLQHVPSEPETHPAPFQTLSESPSHTEGQQKKLSVFAQVAILLPILMLLLVGAFLTAKHHH